MPLQIRLYGQASVSPADVQCPIPNAYGPNSVLTARGWAVIYLAGLGANIEKAVSKTTKKFSMVVVVRYDAS
ncbi:MAG: hypothetical protein F6J93_35580 [Oscillatoria sp. SIO1A7]|nr:hypothetical protein [Oscillatoria sp. SIO1A7]